jgi:hypothetical protein
LSHGFKADISSRVDDVKFGHRGTDILLSGTADWGLTPHVCRHPATATYLMTMGSNPCVADREGAKMAIHYACLYGHWSCTQVMMEPRWVVQNADGLKPLAQAVITDMHGQNRYIDARTCAGLTPLHMAAWAGHVEVAKILLQHGAFLNPKIVFSSPSTSSVLPGSTPTHLATRKNRIHVVKALLSAYVRSLLHPPCCACARPYVLLDHAEACWRCGKLFGVRLTAVACVS